MTRLLRPHQHTALDLLRASYAAGKRRPMLAAPTGFGKTRLAAEITQRMVRRGKRILFVVPALELIDQTARAFYTEGITDIGVIQADHPMTAPERPVQIASIQTLQRRGLPAADLAIVDEGHRWFGFYEHWFAHRDWSDKPIVGMSATPWTRGLGRHYDDLVIPATTAELIKDGYLSEFRVFAPSSPDLSGVRTVAGDYHEGDLAKAANQSALTADVIATWLQRANNRPTLCFAVDRAHAKRLQEQFAAAGVASAYVDAYTSREERERIRRGFHNGEIDVVCNVGVLTTGVDWDVRCLILARPTKSEMLFVQIVGRGLRTAEGKDHCLILDHSDNHARLGFVTDIGSDRLDDGMSRASAKRERAASLPKPCPQCTFMKPPKVRQCPVCGFRPVAQPGIRCEDGELVEITPGKSLAMGSTAVHRLEFLAGLKYYAAQRGYGRGWIAHRFRERFGTWPTGLEFVEPTPPSPTVRGWIKARHIAYAKRRGAA